jgi:hypothetical protein
MRFNINLASRKYEDVRKFYLGWTITLATLGGCALLLAILAAISYVGAKTSSKHIQELETKASALQSERDGLLRTENLPQNRDVVEQKRFWNTQIAKRKFSWTQLFNDLQRIMPARARLVNVQPDLSADNRLKLQLTIEGENRPSARELQEKMESSACFRSPKILTESTQKDSKSGGVGYRFEIESDYVPCASPGRPPSREGI